MRVKTIKKTFDKELPTWSEDTYKVSAKDGMGYIVEDESGEKLRRGRRIGVWMAYELQPATEGKSEIRKQIKTEIKQSKQRHLLKREEIKEGNILEGKRERKAKKIFDV